MNKVNERATQWTIVATGDFPLTEDQVQKVVEEVSDKLGEFASQAPHAIKVHLNTDEQEALNKTLGNDSSRAMRVVKPVKHEPIILFDQREVHDEVKMFNVNIQGSYETHEKLALIEQLQSLLSDNGSTQECVTLAQYKLMGLLNSI